MNQMKWPTSACAQADGLTTSLTYHREDTH